MNKTITIDWMPAKVSTDKLKGKGYSVKQLNHIRRCFIRRHLNKDVADASTAFTNMVKASGAGEDIKHHKPKSEIQQEKNREKDIANKPDDAHEKAVEAHNVKGDMSQESAIEWLKKQRG